MDRNNAVAVPIERPLVALRKESVDRNNFRTSIVNHCAVALRKESVDRNIHAQNFCVSIIGRSPQGERG